ncbi:hypothetical protein PSPO01_09071 [Paraphaeosphaeria sporulosa]
MSLRMMLPAAPKPLVQLFWALGRSYARVVQKTAQQPPSRDCLPAAAARCYDAHRDRANIFIPRCAPRTVLRILRALSPMA